MIDFLRDEVGLEDDEAMVKVIKKFPEVLGHKLDDRLRANVKLLGEKWKIEGATLTSTVLRRPEILGYNVDCVTVGEGGCLVSQRVVQTECMATVCFPKLCVSNIL